MPLHASIVGAHAGTTTATVDDRWAMAYAAGVPDRSPELYDTAAGLVVHPLFPVGPEWALVIGQRVEGTGLTGEEVRRGIHYDHDLVLDAPLRTGLDMRIDARVVSVGRRRAGATQTVEFTANAEDGTRLWRSRNTSLFLGVELIGEPTSVEGDWPAMPAVDAVEPLHVRRSVVEVNDAHVYTECARIWNPIHTDVVAARRAGLAEPILHGTATLARSVSLSCAAAGVPLAVVRRTAGTFRAPVALGSHFDVRVLRIDPDALRFEAVGADGRPVIADGLVGLAT